MSGSIQAKLFGESGDPLSATYNDEGTLFELGPDDPYRLWFADAVLPAHEMNAAVAAMRWSDWCYESPGAVGLKVQIDSVQLKSRAVGSASKEHPKCNEVEPMTPSLDVTPAMSAFSVPSPEDSGSLDLAAPFIGSWHVHGAQLKIESPQRGSISGRCSHCEGDCCLEVASVSFRVSADGKRLYGRVVDIEELDDEGQEQPIKQDPNEGVWIGDQFWLEFVAPRLLKEGYINSNAPPYGGNSYWCGEDLADKYGWYCGA